MVRDEGLYGFERLVRGGGRRGTHGVVVVVVVVLDASGRISTSSSCCSPPPFSCIARGGLGGVSVHGSSVFTIPTFPPSPPPSLPLSSPPLSSLPCVLIVVVFPLLDDFTRPRVKRGVDTAGLGLAVFGGADGV